MPDLTPVLTQDDIEAAVRDLATKISADYKGRELILVAILKGAFIFLSDLVRQLTIPVKVDFLRAASYGTRTSSSGKIRLSKELEIDVHGKDVLVVEDIIDTGLTLKCLLDYLESFGPDSLKVCTLIDKRERRSIALTVDYVGRVVAEGFLVGYGLDYAELYRNLPAIYHLKP